MLKVTEVRWPQTEIYPCEWHLRHALERLSAKIAGQTAEQLLPRTEAAFAACTSGPPLTPTPGSSATRG